MITMIKNDDNNYDNNDNNYDDNNDNDNDNNNDDNIAETLEAARTKSKANIEETLGIALGAAQIVRTANIMKTQRAALVVREAAEDTIRAPQDNGDSKAAEQDRVIEEAA